MFTYAMISLTVITGLLYIKKTIYSFKRELKKCESPIEKKMCEVLYQKGYKPYTQIPCGRYRIDIAIYKKRFFFFNQKVAIECDGSEFHSTPEQIAHDMKKNLFLKKKNWNVIRLRGKDIYHDESWCVKVIEGRTS